jgi:hypothetical protein
MAVLPSSKRLSRMRESRTAPGELVANYQPRCGQREGMSRHWADASRPGATKNGDMTSPTVTEIVVELEPVTRDDFIDDCGGRPVLAPIAVLTQHRSARPGERPPVPRAA